VTILDGSSKIAGPDHAGIHNGEILPLQLTS